MKQLVKPPIILHPFFFCLVPVISLYAQNVYEIYLRQIFIPMAIIVSATVLLFILMRLVTRNSAKAGLLVSLAVGCFFYYGYVYRSYIHFGPFELSRHRYLLVAVIIGYVFAAALIIRSRRTFSRLTEILNVFFVTLFFVIILTSWVNIKRVEARLPYLADWSESERRAMSSTVAYEPDIYYIILDAYAREDVLKAECGFDNSYFLNFLRGKGFYVPNKSNANYAFTDLSLNSSLHMMYLNALQNKLGTGSADKRILYPMLRDNRVVKFLKARGYRFIHCSSTIGATSYNHIANVNIGLPFAPEFAKVLIHNTMLLSFSEHLVNGLERASVRYALRKLTDYSAEPHKPTFFFAHFMVTHPPFLFHADGSAASPEEWSKTGNRWNNKGLYVEQIRFMNSQLTPLITNILSRAAKPPIIILQSDHGCALTWDSEFLTDANPSSGKLAERMHNFIAYYLPGGGTQILYPTITPVNSFRLIFNYYFHAQYARLPDKSYFSSLDHFFDFVPVEFSDDHG